MVLANYYRRFIEGFYKITYPITALQKKDRKFNWNAKCELSFQILKQLLAKPPILNVANPFCDFLVFMDACEQGLEGVLMQNGHVINYELRKLKEHERKYEVHDWELTTIVHAFKFWRHYLIGKGFLLKTDNIGVKYLFD